MRRLVVNGRCPRSTRLVLSLVQIQPHALSHVFVAQLRNRDPGLHASLHQTMEHSWRRFSGIGNGCAWILRREARFSGADHAVAGHEHREFLFCQMFGSRRTLRNDEVPDIRRGVIDAYLYIRV